MNSNHENQNSEPDIILWDWANLLPIMDSTNVRLGKGFLSCRPASWVPHFAAEWLPLAHSLSLDLKILETQPVIALPDGLDLGYGGIIEGEPFGLFFDRELVRAVLEVVTPGSAPVSRDIVLEYLARRFVSTVKGSWVGVGSESIVFDRRVDPFSVDYKGGIRLLISINGVQGILWIGLGRHMISELDGMWKRQQQQRMGGTKMADGVMDLYFEVAQLAVAPSEIVTYTQPGTNIDLEIPASRQIIVRSSEKPLFACNMSQTDGRLCLETMVQNPVQPALQEGMTRISICFGKLSLETFQVQEYQNPGSLWDTGLLLSNQVYMYLNNDVVAQGELCIYDGRFALSVT